MSQNPHLKVHSGNEVYNLQEQLQCSPDSVFFGKKHLLQDLPACGIGHENLSSPITHNIWPRESFRADLTAGWSLPRHQKRRVSTVWPERSYTAEPGQTTNVLGAQLELSTCTRVIREGTGRQKTPRSPPGATAEGLLR